MFLKLSLISLLLFIVSTCKLDITQSNSNFIQRGNNFPIKIAFRDPILLEILCNSFQERGFIIQCFLKKKEEKQNYDFYIDSKIDTVSSDILKNISMSILTLTTGAFVSTSAKNTFSIKNKNMKLLIPSQGKIGLWAYLPPYMGFLATSFGSVLNTNRLPHNLYKYCVIEEPGKYRKTLEQSRDDYCEDYKEFLLDSYYKVDDKFYSILQIYLAKGNK
ncbi:MAG: hypothetical protein H7A23_10545 [Leptospiraceae bacterium]|nr:hypothetical protein [Leptospiraceae bacterium]MCP5494983.1 hypothetical protein [Leptospiraceae bacterium]